MENSQLLCTFTNKENLDEILLQIKKNYNILYNKIFILENTENSNELICTYNIINTNNNVNIKNTINIHRKKDTNTLYTINALNYLITVLNDGILDTKFAIPWSNYTNCILVTNSNEFKKIHTKVNKIIFLDKNI